MRGDIAPVEVNPPGLEVTVYEEIILPPLLTGAEKLTIACALPGIAETPVGAPGRLVGVTVLETPESTLLPAALVAKTVQLTGTPPVSPVTLIGEPGPVALCAPHVAV